MAVRRISGITRGRDGHFQRAVTKNEGYTQPSMFDPVSQLPGAALYPGRIVYVAGTIRHLYMSDGRTWRQITVV